MGKRNVATKKYMSMNDKFADLCNYVLFDGEPVIRPEDLIEKDVTELGIPFTEKGSQAIEKIRDLLKTCTIKSADGVTYLIIGVENLTDIHYAMAVRGMVQDSLNYAAQVEAYARKHRVEKDLRGEEFLSGFAKEDKLI
ncbi:MAG: transposase, partial [Lachnospiraceae bacterium]|nr:transposase [Lachnospiraceae bacterium]